MRHVNAWLAFVMTMGSVSLCLIGRATLVACALRQLSCLQHSYGFIRHPMLTKAFNPWIAYESQKRILYLA